MGPTVAPEIAHALDNLLRDLVFGGTPNDWLSRTEPAAFERWAANGATPAVRLAGQVVRAGWAASGAGETAFLPPLPEASLCERPTGAGGESFAARPDWQGRLYETTVLSRQQAQLLAAHGSGLLTRLAARLVETARLPGQMRALLDRGAAGGGGKGVLGGGRGLAQVEAARGRLIHAVTVEGETVSGYRILAPTEWNFHPQGAVARALAGLDGSGDNALRRQAALLIEAVDPCVGYRLRVQ